MAGHGYSSAADRTDGPILLLQPSTAATMVEQTSLPALRRIALLDCAIVHEETKIAWLEAIIQGAATLGNPAPFHEMLLSLCRKRLDGLRSQREEILASAQVWDEVRESCAKRSSRQPP